VSEWQPIETAPIDEGVKFLAASESYGVWDFDVVEYAYTDTDGEILYWNLGGPAYRPSHWQPLPEPPS
jgi:hypothetical protein